MAQATAPILDSTEVIMPPLAGYGCSRMRTGPRPRRALPQATDRVRTVGMLSAFNETDPEIALNLRAFRPPLWKTPRTRSDAGFCLLWAGMLV
jgi:hypothetical protein